MLQRCLKCDGFSVNHIKMSHERRDLCRNVRVRSVSFQGLIASFYSFLVGVKCQCFLLV